MSYEMMEALLVQKIADLRASEARFEKSFHLLKQDTADKDLNAEYRRMHAQLADVEELIAMMEETASKETLPGLMSVQPISAPVWV